jgi:hypothetical protein
VYRTSWTLAPKPQTVGHPDAVPLTGRGTFSVRASMSASATQAPNDRQLRTEYAYRVHEGDVQVLAPPRKSVVYPRPEGLVQHDVGRLSKLGVHVTA